MIFTFVILPSNDSILNVLVSLFVLCASAVAMLFWAIAQLTKRMVIKQVINVNCLFTR